MSMVLFLKIYNCARLCVSHFLNNTVAEGRNPTRKHKGKLYPCQNIRETKQINSSLFTKRKSSPANVMCVRYQHACL